MVPRSKRPVNRSARKETINVFFFLVGSGTSGP